MIVPPAKLIFPCAEISIPLEKTRDIRSESDENPAGECRGFYAY